jgi:hypothetical protein
LKSWEEEEEEDAAALLQLGPGEPLPCRQDLKKTRQLPHDNKKIKTDVVKKKNYS